MKTSDRRALTTATLLVLAVLFVAATMLSGALLKGLRFDLTEGRLYSVSEGTRNILDRIDEPINLYLFFSDQASEDFPQVRTYATRVRELLEEFALAADGGIRLQVIDPAPFSEDEDRAAEFGLQAVPVGVSGESLYFGLAGTNAVDTVETIGFFQPAKEAFLEYDLAKLVHNLAQPNKPVIGLLSTLPMEGGFDPSTRGMTQPWVVSSQIGQFFEVRSLSPDLDRIEADVDVLMLVHPRDLGEQTLYAVDQFLMGGGKVLLLVDPHAETQQVEPQVAMFAERGSTDAGRLLSAWGIDFDPEQVVLDRRYALQVSSGRGGAPMRHLALLGLDQDALSADDVTTAQLASLNFGTAGALTPTADSELTMEPLASSSPHSTRVAVERIRTAVDPTTLQADFEDQGTPLVLAARFEGRAVSAFADGPPPSEGSEGNTTEQESGPHLDASVEPVNLIVVGDTDLMSDRLWVSIQDFFGQQIVSAWANNADFVINSLDNLAGSSDLISIRGRATSARPFTRVAELEQRADLQFRATEQQLQQRLQETEQKLTELQSAREDDGSLLLSAEQQTELARFQEQKIAIRKELRQVQRNLDRDIERLDSTLKVSQYPSDSTACCPDRSGLGRNTCPAPHGTGGAVDMNSRSLLVVLVVAVVAAVGVVWTEKREQSGIAPMVSDEKLIPTLEQQIAQLSTVTVVKAGSETVATLENSDTGWTVAEKEGYPADTETLAELLRALADARKVERKTSNPELYSRIGVEAVADPDAVGVRVELAGLDTPVSVIVGDINPEAGNVTYVRLARKAESWAVSTEIAPPTDTLSWLDPVILDLAPERIAEVFIRHPDGETLEFGSSDQDEGGIVLKGLPEGREIGSEWEVEALIGALASLQLDDVLPDSDVPEGLGEPVVLEYATFEGMVVEVELSVSEDRNFLRLGARFDPARATAPESAAESPEPATADEEAGRLDARLSPWIYVVGDYVAEIMNKRLEDMLAPLPESEPLQPAE